MASEVLAVPEEHLLEFIRIIRRGLKATRKVAPEVRRHLTEWCDETEAYMKGMEDGD
jgi:hypothetical protein